MLYSQQYRKKFLINAQTFSKLRSQPQRSTSQSDTSATDGLAETTEPPSPANSPHLVKSAIAPYKTDQSSLYSTLSRKVISCAKADQPQSPNKLLSKHILRRSSYLDFSSTKPFETNSREQHFRSDKGNSSWLKFREPLSRTARVNGRWRTGDHESKGHQKSVRTVWWSPWRYFN